MSGNLTYQVPEVPGQHAPEAVEKMARLLGHETVPEVLQISASLALVRGSKGYYSVHRPDGGYWQCSCKAGQFGKRCKHLKAFSASEKGAKKSVKAPMEALDPIARQGIAEEDLARLPKDGAIIGARFVRNRQADDEESRQPFRPTLEAAEGVA